MGSSAALLSTGKLRVTWLWIALGGAGGSVTRAMLMRWQPWAGSVLSILVINVLGSFLIGWLWASVEGRSTPSVTWNALGVGALGGFTTYSTYSLDILRLIEAGRIGTAVVYAGSTVIFALLGCAAGLALGRTQ